MLRWAVIFLVIALIAGLLGFTGIATAAAGIAKFLFYLFLIVCIVLFVAGFMLVADQVTKYMEEVKKTFPAGISYLIPYNSTMFVRAAIKDVLVTLLAADGREIAACQNRAVRLNSDGLNFAAATGCVRIKRVSQSGRRIEAGNVVSKLSADRRELAAH